MSINTDNHRITASFTYAETYLWYDLDVNGFTLDEIVKDMIRFWDSSPESAEAFEVEDHDIVEGNPVVGISGGVRAYDEDGFPSETEVDHVYVLITAEPLDSVT